MSVTFHSVVKVKVSALGMFDKDGMVIVGNLLAGDGVDAQAVLVGARQLPRAGEEHLATAGGLDTGLVDVIGQCRDCSSMQQQHCSQHH